MPHRERNPKAVANAKSQRRAPSQGEALLWRALRGNGINVKFRRQMPIGPYVADFVCLEHRIVVESDGPAHDNPEQRAHDARRDSFLRAHGFRVLRLPDALVRGDTELAVQRIKAALVAPQLASRDPSSDLR